MAKKKKAVRKTTRKKVPANTSRCTSLTIDLDGQLAVRVVNGKKGLQGTMRITPSGIVFVKPNAKRVPQNPVRWSMLFALNELNDRED